MVVAKSLDIVTKRGVPTSVVAVAILYFGKVVTLSVGGTTLPVLRLAPVTAEEEFGFGTTKAFKILKLLCEEGYLLQKKSGKQTVYLPMKD